MRLLTPTDQQLIFHPLDFALRVLRSFSRNQGLVLAGAVAYYALLSLVPLSILAVVVLSRWVDTGLLLATLQRYLEWLVPSQSQALLADVSRFLDNQVSIGLILLITMLFFSSLTFSILQKAMAQIFAHRHATVQRHALVSALLPYSLVLILGLALFGISTASVIIQWLTREGSLLIGSERPLRGLSNIAFYALGLGCEVFVLTLLYIVLPVGRTRFRHALVGAVVVTGIWDGIRHGLVWYFTSLSKASVVYGSLTTAVLALFSIEIAATLVLLGAQVIAEYEQLADRLDPTQKHRPTR